MANSYLGVNGLGASSGDPSSFSGQNAFSDPDDRKVLSSQIQDTGVRSLLQDQFQTPNSYSKLGVAPLGGLQKALQQYATVDQFKLDDSTRSFIQPYLTGVNSSLSPSTSFITRDKLEQAKRARSAPSPSLSYLWSMYDPSIKAGQTLSRNVIADVSGADQIAQAQRYAQMGFVPGSSVGAYKWYPSTFKNAVTYGPSSGQWSMGGENDPGIMWDPKRGYTLTAPMDESAAMRDSIKTVASVIGGIILPGLAATGQLGAAANAGTAATPTENAIDAGALGGQNTGALGPASLGDAGMFGNGGMFGTGLDLGNGYLNTIGEGTVRSGLTSNGNPKAMLSGAVSGGLGAVSGALSQMAQQYGISPSVLRAILSGGGRAISGMIGGENAGSALQSGVLSGLGRYAGNLVGGATGFAPAGAFTANLINTGDAKNSLFSTALGALGRYNQNSQYRK